jgi:RHS repeat-associated protein
VIGWTGSETSYSYSYDDNGNIIKISDGSHEITYAYDTANQLVRENHQEGGYSYVWTYDEAGNIKSRKEYAYTTGELGAVLDTISYSYGNSEWGDLLTQYDGRSYSYDTIGNVTSDGRKSYTWKHGRELQGVTDENGAVWENTYDANGKRIRREKNTKIYSYVYTGDQLSHMTITNVSTEATESMRFTYDAEGYAQTINYQGTVYYYVTNMQGDVIGIIRGNGTQVVAYRYDAWGNVKEVSGSMSGTLGKANPLRYRGYVYDEETKLYYLESRYYDPEVGRFINADAYAATG